MIGKMIVFEPSVRHQPRTKHDDFLRGRRETGCLYIYRIPFHRFASRFQVGILTNTDCAKAALSSAQTTERGVCLMNLMCNSTLCSILQLRNGCKQKRRMGIIAGEGDSLTQELAPVCLGGITLAIRSCPRLKSVAIASSNSAGIPLSTNALGDLPRCADIS